MEDEHNLGMADRLTALPSDLVLYILSLVNLMDLIRVGCISKKCMELSLSVPSLDLDGNSTMYKKSKSRRISLLNQVDRYLTKRGSRKLERLRISWSFRHPRDYDEQYRTNTWICHAVNCNIEELELVISMFEGVPIEIPYLLFQCSSLRVLKVEFNKATLKVPSFAVPTNLQQLTLRNVTISEEVWRWISSIRLKKLWLEFVFGIESVVINSSTLELFHIALAFHDNNIVRLRISGDRLEDINITGPFDFRGIDSLEIVAPNLKHIMLMGELLNQLHLGKFTCLEEVELYLSPTQDDYSKLHEVLCSMCKTKFLHLDEKTIQVLSNGPITPMPLPLPLPLHDLSCFRAYVWKLTDDLVPNLVYLLRRMPYLSTLFIGTSPSLVFERVWPNSHIFYRGNSSGPLDMVNEHSPAIRYNVSNWRAQKMVCILHVKEVRIDISNETTNEIELARYIIEDARNLKKMVIIHSHRQAVLVRMMKASKPRFSAAQIILSKKKRGGS